MMGRRIPNKHLTAKVISNSLCLGPNQKLNQISSYLQQFSQTMARAHLRNIPDVVDWIIIQTVYLCCLKPGEPVLDTCIWAA